MTTTLLDLGFDITELSLLASEFSMQNVIYLSMVSRQMREHTLPFMFSSVKWPNKRYEMRFLPASLWPYIKTLEYLLDPEAPWWAARHKTCLGLLSKAFPQMPNIATFFYGVKKFAPDVGLIQALASSSCLHSLHFPTTFLIHDASILFRSFAGIRRLIIEQVGHASLYSAPASKRVLSVQCVSNIIHGCSETLEYLDIPGEYCPLADLYTRKITLPVLRKFILRGFPPLESDSQEYPLWTAVRSMQNINVFEVHCKLRIIGAVPKRYELLPANASFSEAGHFSSQIESITISNPSLSDRIFEMLPPSLGCLVLDFIPVWENMLSSGDTLAYHKPGKMLELLNSLRVPSRPSLEQLCIKMGWCVTPEILKSIYQIFPSIRELELQGIQYFNRAEEPESDMESIVKSLEQFQHLHTLKLAVEFREDSYQEDDSSRAHKRIIGSVDQAMKLWANVLSGRIKPLRRLAFEKRRHTGKGYGLGRAVTGDPLWVWFSIDMERGKTVQV